MRSDFSLYGHQAGYEKRLLSCLLNAGSLGESETISMVMNIVAAGDFVDDRCREFFVAISRLHTRGEPINPNSVYGIVDGLLGSKSEFEELLSDVAELEAHSAYARHYAEEIHRYDAIRRMIAKLLDTASQLRDVTCDFSEVTLNFDDYREFIMKRGAGGLDMKTLGDAEAVNCDWLWEGRIPLGNLTLLQGQPGIGKSFASIDFASRVAMGWEWPDGTEGGEPREVIYLTAEDDEQTIAKRFDNIVADRYHKETAKQLRSRIHIMGDGIREFHDGKLQSRFIDLGKDLHHVEDFLQGHPKVGMIIVDTAGDFMGSAKQNDNSEVRAVYGPVARMAKRRKIAVVLISHFNKNTANTQAIYRGLGSLAFVALCRVSWGFFRDPMEKRRVIFAPIKNNLGPMAPAMGYEIVEPGTTAWEPDGFEADPDALMQQPKPKANTQRDKAKNWLSDQLADGPVEVETLKDRAGEFDVSWKTIERASNDLQVTKRPVGANGDKSWYWSLNGTPP